MCHIYSNIACQSCWTEFLPEGCCQTLSIVENEPTYLQNVSYYSRPLGSGQCLLCIPINPILSCRVLWSWEVKALTYIPGFGMRPGMLGKCSAQAARCAIKCFPGVRFSQGWRQLYKACQNLHFTIKVSDTVKHTEPNLARQSRADAL